MATFQSLFSMYVLPGWKPTQWNVWHIVLLAAQHSPTMFDLDGSPYSINLLFDVHRHSPLVYLVQGMSLNYVVLEEEARGEMCEGRSVCVRVRCVG